MKKVYFIYLVMGLMVVSGIIAFKNSDRKDIPATIENLAGSYRLIEVTSNEAGKESHSIYSIFLTECEQDDVVKLNMDFSAVHFDEGLVCRPSGLELGRWALPGKNNIEIEGALGTISKFDGSTLMVTINDKESASNAAITLTYSRL